MDHLKNALNGSLSSGASVVVCSPLDVLKTQYQVSQNNVTYGQLVKNIVKQQGLRGFYKGLASNLSTRPIFYTAYFPMVEALKPIKFTNGEYTNKIVQCTLAGWSGIIATNPLWVMKTRMQTQLQNQDGSLVSNNNRLSYARMTSDMIRKEGISSLYKGCGVSLLKGTEIGIIFPMRDYLKDHMQMNPLIASSATKFTGNCFLYPLDVIRTYQRKQKKNLGLIDCGKELYYKHNRSIIKGWYRGLGMYCFASIPQFAIMMACYDWLKK